MPKLARKNEIRAVALRWLFFSGKGMFNEMVELFMQIR